MRGTRTLLSVIVVGAVVTIAAFLLRPNDSRSAGPTRAAAAPAGAAASASGGQASTPIPPAVEPEGETGTGNKSALTLIGSVQSEAQATLSARAPARIAAVYVREGDTVQHGQLLVQLDDTDFRTQEQTAQAGVAAAQAQLQKAQAGRTAQKVKADADLAAAQSGLAQAEAKRRQAELARDAARDDARADLATAQEGVRKAQAALDRALQTLHGLEELDKVGGVSRSDLEGARTQAQVAQSDLATAQAQVRRLEAGPNGAGGPPYRVALAQQDVDAAQAGVRQAQDALHTAMEGRRQTLALADQDIRAAQAALTQAQVGVASARAARAQTRLTSPINGAATAVTARAGETAQPGGPLVTVVSLSGLRVDALVPARQLALLHVGQAARIMMDTLPGRTLPAVVGEIARAAEPDGRTFRVRLRLRAAVSLRPGQTARITVLPNA